MESSEIAHRIHPQKFLDETPVGTGPTTSTVGTMGGGNHHERGNSIDARDRVLETRTDHHTQYARDYKVTERDGVIDLTDQDIDSIYRADVVQPVEETHVPEKESEPNLEERQTDVPMAEVVVLSIKGQTDTVSVDQKRKRLKERLASSKEKMEKLGALLKVKPRKDEKKKEKSKKSDASENGKSRISVSNSLLQGDSVNTQRESLPSKAMRKNSSTRSTPTFDVVPRESLLSKATRKNSSTRSTPTFEVVPPKIEESPFPSKPDPIEDRNEEVSLRQSGSATEIRLREPPGLAIADDASADPIISARTVPTPEPEAVEAEQEREEPEMKPSPLENEEAIDDIKHNSEEIQEDQFSSGCNWYLCSDQQNKSTMEEAKLDRESKVLNNGDDQGIWESILYWIDPAPTLLVETLKERLAEEEDTVVTETSYENPQGRDLKFDEEAENTNNAVFNNTDTIPALFQSPDTADDADEADEAEEEKDIDQDSGTVSDAGLNSMPPLEEEKANESFSLNGLQPTLESAFDVVKPSALSPAASLEECPLENDDDLSRNMPDDDASSIDDASEAKFFGDDLKSLPSVKEDLTEGVSELQPDDLGSELPQPDSPSIAQTMEKLRRKEAKKMESKKAYQAKADESLEARRQSLVKELRSAIATFGRYDIRCAKITADLGDVLDEGGDHVHAVRLHKDATTIYSCKLGDDHSTTMNAKMRLGAVLENANQYDEAIGMYYLVTVMRRALHGENDPTVGDGLVQMAQTLRKKSDYLQAIKELKRALKVYRESLGDTNEKVANTVDQIASLYVTVGDFEKSAAILEEVVKLKAATMGMSSKPVAQTLSTLATTYECSEKFNGAMKALKKAYKIYTEIGGYSSEDSTNILNRIAQLYEATGDQNRAAIAYLGVLRARKVLLGADSLPVGETYFRLGHSLRETGQFDKALKCLKEALPIFVGQGVEMNDMKMVADIMHEMAFINQDKGNHQDAVRIFKQELSVRRKIGQPSFPLIARTLNHLGVAEFHLQNNTKALKYLVEALTIFQERGEQGIECAEVLFNTGLVFDAVQNNDRALDAYTEARRIFRDRGYGEDHPHLKKVNEKIARLNPSTQS
jgi:tetratricopeptide (TPR) repeat protein